MFIDMSLNLWSVGVSLLYISTGYSMMEKKCLKEEWDFSENILPKFSTKQRSLWNSLSGRIQSYIVQCFDIDNENATNYIDLKTVKMEFPGFVIQLIEQCQTLSKENNELKETLLNMSTSLTGIMLLNEDLVDANNQFTDSLMNEISKDESYNNDLETARDIIESDFEIEKLP